MFIIIEGPPPGTATISMTVTFKCSKFNTKRDQEIQRNIPTIFLYVTAFDDVAAARCSLHHIMFVSERFFYRMLASDRK